MADAGASPGVDKGAHDAGAHDARADAPRADAQSTTITLDGSYTGHFAATESWAPTVGGGTCDIALSVALELKASLVAVAFDPVARTAVAGPASALTTDDTFSGNAMGGMCKSSSAIQLRLTAPLSADPRTGAYGLVGEGDGVLRDPLNNVSEPVHFVFLMDGGQFGQDLGGLQSSFDATFTLSDPHFIGSGSFGGRATFDRN